MKTVVTDSFETEASREVTASAGLMAQEVVQNGDEQNVVLSHQVRHQVALPPDYEYIPISQHKIEHPARTYPFTLDPFQKYLSTQLIVMNQFLFQHIHQQEKQLLQNMLLLKVYAINSVLFIHPQLKLLVTRNIVNFLSDFKMLA